MSVKRSVGIITIVIIIAMVALLLNVFLIKSKTSFEEPVKDECEFFTSSEMGELTFGEQQAGTFNYELYMLADGTIEVWKCDRESR